MGNPMLIHNPSATSKTVLVSENCWANRLLSFWLVRYACIILSCISMIIFISRYYTFSRQTNETHALVIPSWDFLLFTQSFPVTCCIWWELSKEARCNLAHDEHAWTIHGIWPTKNDTEGPFECHNEMKFNETAIKSIENDLHEHWYSVGMMREHDLKFWEHEWKKHGTCAIDDQIFDSEFTYFQLGLKWHQQWNVTGILNEAGIIPSNTNAYTRTQFRDAIYKKLGKNPYLDCFYYTDLNIYLINEIRLCVAKDTTLLDCDSMYTNDNGTCIYEEFIYPDTLTLGDFKKSKIKV